MNIPKQSNQIDDVFKKGIEGLSLPPLALNLDGIRANTLAGQLSKATQQILMLKSLAGLLALLFCGTGLGLYQARNLALPKQATITYTKTDTVYITRLEKVYIPVIQQINFDESTSQSKAHFLSNTSTIETFDLNKAESKPINNEVSIGNDKNAEKIIQVADNHNIVDGNKPTEKSKSGNDTELNTGSENKNELTLYTQLVRSTLLNLKTLSTNFDTKFTMPNLSYKLPVSPQKENIKLVKPPMTLAERVSIGVYAGIENSKVSIRKDEISAFSYGNESITSTKVYGMKIGLKLNNKWRILTGYEDVDYVFQSNNAKKMDLKAELIDGVPSYVYRSIFGSALVANSELQTLPKLGEEIVLESENNHIAGYDRFPLTIRYDFLSKNFTTQNYRRFNINLYGFLGGVYSVPTHQELKVELYEKNGHDFYTTLQNFKNTSSTLGLNFGGGVEANITKQLSFWIEPNYNLTLTSMVKNLPLRTYPHSLGLKFGLNFQF